MRDTDRKTEVTQDSAGKEKGVEIVGKNVGVEKATVKIVGGANHPVETKIVEQGR